MRRTTQACAHTQQEQHPPSGRKAKGEVTRRQREEVGVGGRWRRWCFDTGRRKRMYLLHQRPPLRTSSPPFPPKPPKTKRMVPALALYQHNPPPHPPPPPPALPHLPLPAWRRRKSPRSAAEPTSSNLGVTTERKARWKHKGLFAPLNFFAYNLIVDIFCVAATHEMTETKYRQLRECSIAPLQSSSSCSSSLLETRLAEDPGA